VRTVPEQPDRPHRDRPRECRTGLVYDRVRTAMSAARGRGGSSAAARRAGAGAGPALSGPAARLDEIIGQIEQELDLEAPAEGLMELRPGAPADSDIRILFAVEPPGTAVDPGLPPRGRRCRQARRRQPPGCWKPAWRPGRCRICYRDSSPWNSSGSTTGSGGAPTASSARPTPRPLAPRPRPVATTLARCARHSWSGTRHGTRMSRRTPPTLWT